MNTRRSGIVEIGEWSASAFASTPDAVSSACNSAGAHNVFGCRVLHMYVSGSVAAVVLRANPARIRISSNSRSCPRRQRVLNRLREPFLHRLARCFAPRQRASGFLQARPGWMQADVVDQAGDCRWRAIVLRRGCIIDMNGLETRMASPLQRPHQGALPGHQQSQGTVVGGQIAVATDAIKD